MPLIASVGLRQIMRSQIPASKLLNAGGGLGTDTDTVARAAAAAAQVTADANTIILGALAVPESWAIASRRRPNTGRQDWAANLCPIQRGEHQLRPGAHPRRHYIRDHPWPHKGLPAECEWSTFLHLSRKHHSGLRVSWNCGLGTVWKRRRDTRCQIPLPHTRLVG